MHSRSCLGMRPYAFHHRKANTDCTRLYSSEAHNRNVLFVAIFTVKICPSRFKMQSTKVLLLDLQEDGRILLSVTEVKEKQSWCSKRTGFENKNIFFKTNKNKQTFFFCSEQIDCSFSSFFFYSTEVKCFCLRKSRATPG